MMEDKDTLIEWNHLNINNAERNLVKAFFVGALSSSSAVDRYASWLLAGIAGTAALFITGVESILPYVSEEGFRWCGALLVISGLFGLMAKLRALQVQISVEQGRVLDDAMSPVLDEYRKFEQEIQDHAQIRGISLDTDIDLKRVGSTFISAFPKFMHGFLHKSFDRGMSDYYSSQKIALRSLIYQGVFTGFETFFFVAFVIVAVLYSSAI